MSTLRTSLGQRLITASIAIPILLGILWYNGPLVILTLGIIFCLSLWEFRKLFLPRLWASYAFAIIMAIGFFSLYHICYGEGAFLQAIILFGVVFGSDTLAFVFGKNLKGPKIAPKISPNKTWAGLLGAVIAPIIVLHFAFSPSNDILFTLFAGCLGVVGQAGDFLESYLKRKADVKDSGALLPGHGGILDRIDALLVISPLMLIFYSYIL
tara:strand:- start:1452 stop:2084 length:633 start_codon:yes stop_codon:yes gene_type:complete